KSNVGKFVRATTQTITRAIRGNSVACNIDPSSAFKITANTNDPDSTKIR
ncbi:hypothetical protein PIROE2DRAFT_18600, partial [Piromyces sp. E2]